MIIVLSDYAQLSFSLFISITLFLCAIRPSVVCRDILALLTATQSDGARAQCKALAKRSRK